MASFPQVSPLEPCAHLSPPPYEPHAPPISFFSILSPAQPENTQHPRKTDIHAPDGLRRIMNTKWTDKITNEELGRITHQKSIENQMKRRKWNWIGHTLRKEIGAIEKNVLEWNPQEYRRKGKLKRTWRRTIEDEIRSTRIS